MTTGSNLKLTTCTINTKSYSNAYIAMQSLNPISQLHATTGTWYYYPVTAMYDSTGAPITFTSADTVTIKFDPTTLSTTATIYTFLQSQGGKCGTSSSTNSDSPLINELNYGGAGGGGAGGQIYSRWLTSTTTSVTVNLYPTSSTSNSYYSYNGNTVTAGNGGAGGNGADGSFGTSGKGGAGGNGSNDGSGGNDSYYYGGSGGNGGAAGTGATVASSGAGGSGKTPGGSSGQSFSPSISNYNNQTLPYTTVTLADNTTAQVGKGGKGGCTINSSMAPTAGAGANFMVYFTA
jgi:hypothetical protein